MYIYRTLIAAVVSAVLVACSSTEQPNLSAAEDTNDKLPASKFDLSEWKITVPLDKDKNGKIDEIDVKAIQSYCFYWSLVVALHRNLRHKSMTPAPMILYGKQ